MTYTEQTSASDRYEAAEKALAEIDHRDAAGEICWHDIPQEFEDARNALRALITPPSVGESIEQIAESTLRASSPPAVDPRDGLWCFTPQQVRDMTERAVRAGIQSAHETWEMETAQRPSQEQMLRWLGIRYTESQEFRYVYIPLQQIEREEI